MTKLLFRDLPYQKTTTATVTAITAEGGIVLDRTIFYPMGGGQPGDSGELIWTGTQTIKIASAVKGQGDAVVLVPTEPRALPEVGMQVTQTLDWDRRLLHMRMHTALHLLSVAIGHSVTGGSIGSTRSRLDFDMPEAPQDRDSLEELLNFWVGLEAPVSDRWITEAELDANPNLVKTLTVQPPRGAGRIRLVQIGEKPDIIDLQPCGGTHVASTREIGVIRLSKVVKKGRQNRRVYIVLE